MSTKSEKKQPGHKKATSKKTAAKKRAGTSSRKMTAVSGDAWREPARESNHEAMELRSEVESGDLQGLRGIEDVDSESVEELIEEGNAFEAAIVMGVEEAEDHDGREVYTHEVPEDDVPEEYRNED
jgi:hypothetical protein